MAPVSFAERGPAAWAVRTCFITTTTLKLIRLGGHLILWEGGIHNAEIKTAVRAGRDMSGAVHERSNLHYDGFQPRPPVPPPGGYRPSPMTPSSPSAHGRSRCAPRASARAPVSAAASAEDASCRDVPGTSSGANPSLSHPAAGCSAIAASSALRMRARISGGNRPCSTTVPSSSCQKVRPRFSCWASARSVSATRLRHTNAQPIRNRPFDAAIAAHCATDRGPLPPARRP